MGNPENYIGKQLWVSKNLPNTKMICVDMKEYNDKSHIDICNGIFIDDMSKNLITSNAKEKILFGDECSWNEGCGLESGCITGLKLKITC